MVALSSINAVAFSIGTHRCGIRERATSTESLSTTCFKDCESSDRFTVDPFLSAIRSGCEGWELDGDLDPAGVNE
jgi:hypothetical protein